MDMESCSKDRTLNRILEVICGSLQSDVYTGGYANGAHFNIHPGRPILLKFKPRGYDYAVL